MDPIVRLNGGTAVGNGAKSLGDEGSEQVGPVSQDDGTTGPPGHASLESEGVSALAEHGENDSGIPQAATATVAVQGGPERDTAQLRVDYGAHLEANYQRLVAQLYAITLDPGEAHDVVQDAYSRAWRGWSRIGVLPDPTGWVRRVAVRSTMRSWRRIVQRAGLHRHRVGDSGESRTGAMLAALGRLTPPERRAVVLSHMVGMTLPEIAALERVASRTVAARLTRARLVMTEGMADVLPAVLGPYEEKPR